MKLNKTIHFVIQDNKVILLDTSTEEFMLLTDKIDLNFFSKIKNGETVENVLESLKQDSKLSILKEEYLKNKILVEKW